MKNLGVTTFICLFTLGVSSCTKERVIIRETHDRSNASEEVDEGARKKVEAIKPICDSERSCHPSVAQIGFATAKESWVCTAFLVSDKTIITNSHCVPDEGKKFKGYISFPSQGSMPEIRSEIAETIYQSAPTHSLLYSLPSQIAQDFAVVNLKDPILRPFIKISNEAIIDGGEYDTFVVDPAEDENEYGKVRPEKCTANLGTIYDGDYARSGTTAISSLKNCSVQPGNSGSPLLNKRGEAVGVLSAYIEVASYLKSNEGYIPTVEQETSNSRHTIASRFGCAALTTEVLKKNNLLMEENCRTGFRLKDLVLRKKIDVSPVIEKYPTLLNPLLDDSALFLEVPENYEEALSHELEILPKENQTFLVASPGCYRPEFETTFSPLILLVSTKKDSDFRVDLTIEGIGGTMLKLSADPMKKKKWRTVDLSLESGKIISHSKLEVCL
jgi:hypothetical protein